MEENKNLVKMLKWAGIVALVALPIVVLLKKRKDRDDQMVGLGDDNDIFEPHLK